jgi:hypothetical protein
MTIGQRPASRRGQGTCLSDTRALRRAFPHEDRVTKCGIGSSALESSSWIAGHVDSRENVTWGRRVSKRLVERHAPSRQARHRRPREVIAAGADCLAPDRANHLEHCGDTGELFGYVLAEWLHGVAAVRGSSNRVRARAPNRRSSLEPRYSLVARHNDIDNLVKQPVRALLSMRIAMNVLVHGERTGMLPALATARRTDVDARSL